MGGYLDQMDGGTRLCMLEDMSCHQQTHSAICEFSHGKETAIGPATEKFRGESVISEQ